MSIEERNNIFLNFKKNNKRFYEYILYKENISFEDKDEATQIIDETLLDLIPTWSKRKRSTLNQYAIKACRTAVRVLRFSMNSIPIPKHLMNFSYCYYKDKPLSKYEEPYKLNFDLYMRLKFLQVDDRDMDNKHFYNDTEDRVDKKIFRKIFKRVYSKTKLTQKQRRLIDNHYFKNISFTEMAKTENGSSKNLSGITKYALKKLRQNEEMKKIFKEYCND